MSFQTAVVRTDSADECLARQTDLRMTMAKERFAERAANTAGRSDIALLARVFQRARMFRNNTGPGGRRSGHWQGNVLPPYDGKISSRPLSGPVFKP